MSNPAHEGGSYSGLPNLQVSATNGINYAYRDTSPGNTSGIPLVLLQRFRGNLDNWDPVLIDALVSKRHVLAVERDASLAAGHPSPSVSMHRWFPAVVTEFPICVVKRPSSCQNLVGAGGFEPPASRL